MEASQKVKKIEALIARLNQDDVFLVVEGKRDAASLRNVGITCGIVKANGKPEHLVDKIASKYTAGFKPLILFDFDETGNERVRQLNELLLARGCVADVETRKKFRLFFGLRCFEEADRKLDKIMEDVEKNKK